MEVKADLGKLLTDFFDYYGNKFRFEEQAVTLHGPKARKETVGGPSNDNDVLLHIEDPQNRYNNVGRSSYQFTKVVSAFRNCHRILGPSPSFRPHSPSPPPHICPPCESILHS